MTRKVKQIIKEVGGLVTIEYDDYSVVAGQFPIYSQDTSGNAVGLIGPKGYEWIVVDAANPDDNDGRPDGTVYIQTA